MWWETRLEVCSFLPACGYSIVSASRFQQDILFPIALKPDNAFSATLLFWVKTGLALQVPLHSHRSISTSRSR